MRFSFIYSHGQFLYQVLLNQMIFIYTCIAFMVNHIDSCQEVTYPINILVLEIYMHSVICDNQQALNTMNGSMCLSAPVLIGPSIVNLHV